MTGMREKLPNSKILNVFIIAFLTTVLLCRNCFIKKRGFNSTEPNSVLQNGIYLYLIKGYLVE